MTEDDSTKIIRAYGKVYEDVFERLVTHYPAVKFPQSLLPYNKSVIANALKIGISLNKDNKESLEALTNGLVALDEFIDDREAYIENNKILDKDEYWKGLADKGLI